MSVVIKLNREEYVYLCQATFLPSWFKVLLSPIERQQDVYLLNISEDEIDKIRDLCGEQLQLVGFDITYKTTQEGEILESLIDKFFVG